MSHSAGSRRSPTDRPSTNHRRKHIMQVHQILASIVLAVATAGAIAQQPAAPANQVVASYQAPATATTAARSQPSECRLDAGPSAGAAAADRPLTRAEVKADLAAWRRSHPLHVGELD